MNEYTLGCVIYTGNDVEYKYICACYAGMSAIEEIMGADDEQ